jgi:hypothetical protein
MNTGVSWSSLLPSLPRGRRLDRREIATSGPDQRIPLELGKAKPTPNRMPYSIARIRRLHGGSQAQMLLCSDGFYYAVKFQNNPQGRRSLASEMLGTLLAMELGLSTQQPAVIHVDDNFVHSASDMCVERPTGTIRYQPGLCYGSRYPHEVAPQRKGRLAIIRDELPSGPMSWLLNGADFAGMLVFDQWTCNTDDRQVIFWRTMNCMWFRASMIDQGHCFAGARWRFPDSTMWGRYRKSKVHAGFKTFDAFEPWLQRLECKVGEATLREAARAIPSEWYDDDVEALDRLLEELDARRKRVRELVWSAARCSPDWFSQFGH